MAQALRNEQITLADELRERLAQGERWVAARHRSATEALSLLEGMDRIESLFSEIRALGADLRAESGRWQTLQAEVRRKSAVLLRELRSIGGIEGARAGRQAQPSPGWWWQMDGDLRALRRSQRRRMAVTAIVLLLIGMAAVFAAMRFLRVDPQAVASIARQMDGQQKIEASEDYEGALADFQQAVSLAPDDETAWLWLAVVHQKRGDGGEAERAFAQARQLVDSDAAFWLARVPVYLAVGLTAEAESDVERVLAANPEDPAGHFYKADLMERRGEYEAAIAALERAAALAEQSQPELAAVARVRMAMLLQRLPGQIQVETPTAEAQQ